MSELDFASYNQYLTYPNIQYQLIMYLIDNNETIWKMLKYESPDAWKQPNLSRKEKMDLIYRGTGNQCDFNVFMDEGQNDVFTESTCLLRIFPYELFPENYVETDIYVCFQILTYYDINHLSNYQTRTDVIVSELLRTFNGKSIDGVGRIVFDRNTFPRCKAGTYSTKPFMGKLVVMGINYRSNENEC